MDCRSAFQPMEHVQGLGFLAASALLLGVFIHGR
jgi:hypothetical protein